MNDNLSAAKILCLSEPAWKNPLGFTYSICFRTNCWKLLSSEDHNKGEKVDDGHFGIIRIPWPLHNAKWEIVLQISLTGGTIQQLWPDQIKVITKLPNSEQSYKGKVKTHNYIIRQNQSTAGKLWKP